MAAHITQKLNENTTPHLCFLPKQTSLVVSGWKSPNRFELENKTSKQSHCYVFRKMKRNKKVAAETRSMHASRIEPAFGFQVQTFSPLLSGAQSGRHGKTRRVAATLIATELIVLDQKVG